MLKNISLLLSLLLFFSPIYALGEAQPELDVPCAVLIDMSGEVLYEKNASERRPVASVTKLMTLLIIFEELEAGRYRLEDTVSVSLNAQRMGGSQALIDASSTYEARELIKSIIVASANDSCVAMAEFIYGDEDVFVDAMNTHAEKLGLTDTHFVNCTGLPEEGQFTTARDVAVMAKQLFTHETYFEFSPVWMFYLRHSGGRQTILSNTNKLLKSYDGCDGGKTGFTNEAKYCMAVTAKKADSRYIAVVLGASTSDERNAALTKLLDFGFANYETRLLFEKGEVVKKDIPVSNAERDSVDAVTGEKATVLIKRAEADGISYELSFNENLAAPIERGLRIGTLHILKDGAETGTVPLLSAQNAERASYAKLLRRVTARFRAAA